MLRADRLHRRRGRRRDRGDQRPGERAEGGRGDRRQPRGRGRPGELVRPPQERGRVEGVGPRAIRRRYPRARPRPVRGRRTRARARRGRRRRTRRPSTRAGWRTPRSSCPRRVTIISTRNRRPRRSPPIMSTRTSPSRSSRSRIRATHASRPRWVPASGKVGGSTQTRSSCQISRRGVEQAGVPLTDALTEAIERPLGGGVHRGLEQLVLAGEDLGDRVVGEDAADRIGERLRRGEHVDVVRGARAAAGSCP